VLLILILKLCDLQNKKKRGIGCVGKMFITDADFKKIWGFLA